jgi:hypothetical protein
MKKEKVVLSGSVRKQTLPLWEVQSNGVTLELTDRREAALRAFAECGASRKELVRIDFSSQRVVEDRSYG